MLSSRSKYHTQHPNVLGQLFPLLSSKSHTQHDVAVIDLQYRHRESVDMSCALQYNHRESGDMSCPALYNHREACMTVTFWPRGTRFAQGVSHTAYSGNGHKKSEEDDSKPH